MTGDPDVTPIGFAATDAPGALVRRRRNPVWLVLAVLLTGAGVAATAWFIVAQFDNAPGRKDAVANGRVAALRGAPVPVVRFTGQGDYTVWLETDGVRLSNTRELVVAATTCTAAFEHGGSIRFRGARQGASVTIGDRSTVGTFSMPAGAVVLICSQQPFGRRGRQRALTTERSFFVTPGKPGIGWQPWVGLFGGIGLLLLAAPAFGRYRTGYLRPR